MRTFLLVVGCLLCVTLKAQHQSLFEEYRREAGTHAAMFMGKLENGYPLTVYKNQPYWSAFGQFAVGEVMYNGLLYTNLSLRYDAFLKQLIVSTEQGMHVCVQMDLVESFRIEEVPFVRRSGEFVALLYGSPQVELVEVLHCLPEDVFGEDRKSRQSFAREQKYYLLKDGEKHEVAKLNSILKLFPMYKKELKRFAKQYNLDFKEHRQSSLKTMIEYADSLASKH